MDESCSSFSLYCLSILSRVCQTFRIKKTKTFTFQMSLWCDKYRPKTFDELDYQLEQAELLKTIVSSGDFPHFLIFGPSGSGKKTRITCLLHALYGDGVQSLRIENHEYETPSRKKIEITTIGSNFHTQVNPR